MPAEEILAQPESQGLRLDVFLAGSLEERFTRSQIKKLIEEGRITVRGKTVTPHYKVKTGDRVEISSPPPLETVAKPEEIPLEILYEDEELIVLNKPAGMVVHPAQGNREHTLVNALLYHVKNLSGQGGERVRPGIVHRLDKETSGVMVAAKNEKAHHFLARQFRDHTIERVYHVIVQGRVQHDESLCEEPVGRAYLNRKKIMIRPSGGKTAKTYVRVLRRFSKASLLEVRPYTGRTHQIRVHMSHMGHPVLGDPLYGVRSPWILRQALHAKSLGFRHPVTREKIFFDTNLPKDMARLLRQLEATP